jgi:hypothetical protein
MVAINHKTGERAVRAQNLVLALWAALATAMASWNAFAESAVIVKAMRVDEVVRPDGVVTTLFHVERIATNQSAAHRIAQQTVEYSESMETAEIVEAFTHKKDGRVLEVDRSQIFAQLPPGSPQVPMFTDRKQKVIVFPDVSIGDLVVFTIKRTHKPAFVGQFFAGDVFRRGLAFEDVREDITLPRAMTARVEVRGVEHQVEEAAETITHKFRYRNPQPRAAEPTELSPWDTDAHWIISTFADYPAIATAYRQLAAEKAAVTPRIQALAEEITQGTSGRREQAQKIYDWVSKHIRYVAVILGNGGYEPHEAIKILENGYGDCKDHVVLLEALLKAKGIASVPALINSGNRYGVPEAATPALFNHVISYLPEFNVYADSTAGVAPFGTLPAAEYGKPVAVAAEGRVSFTSLPLVAAGANEEELQTETRLMTDGSVLGESTTIASGPFGIVLRRLAASIEARGHQQWAAAYFKSLGWAGKASFRFDPPSDRLTPTYALSASFNLEPRPEFLEGNAFAPFEGIRMLVRPGQFLLGPWTLPKEQPTPCYSGHQVEELTLTLPPGHNVGSLPSGKTVENPYLRYQSVWHRDGQTIKVRREITVKLPVVICRDEIRARLAEAITEIRGDYSTTIALQALSH